LSTIRGKARYIRCHEELGKHPQNGRGTFHIMRIQGKGEESQNTKKGASIMPKIDKEEALTLWNKGLLDAEIAKHSNCSKVAVQQWRKRNYLKSNSVNNNSATHERITKLWENGLKDSEIAKELKCSTITVWKFRQENEMDSNVGIFKWDGAKEHHGGVEGKKYVK